MKYIALFGSIGVGKTTLGTKLEELYENFKFVPEVLTDNIYLSNFYSDMKKYAFKSSVEMLYLMASKYTSNYAKDDIIIFDNGLEELICYNNFMLNEGILDNDEYNLYKKLYDTFIKLIPKTELFIYAHCDINTQLERIKLRNRDYEKYIDYNFLTKLNNEYNKYVDKIDKDKLIIIDTNKEINYDELIKSILAKI